MSVVFLKAMQSLQPNGCCFEDKPYCQKAEPHNENVKLFPAWALDSVPHSLRLILFFVLLLEVCSEHTLDGRRVRCLNPASPIHHTTFPAASKDQWGFLGSIQKHLWITVLCMSVQSAGWSWSGPLSTRCQATLFLTDLLLPVSRQGEDARSVTARSVAAVVENKACAKEADVLKKCCQHLRQALMTCLQQQTPVFALQEMMAACRKIFVAEHLSDALCLPQDERCPRRCP